MNTLAFRSPVARRPSPVARRPSSATEDRRKLVNRERLRPRARLDTRRCERRIDDLGRRAPERAQNSLHLLAAHAEDVLHETTKFGLFLGLDRWIWPRIDTHHGALDLGRRLKRSRRDAKENSRNGNRLHVDGERAVLLGPRRRDDPIRDLTLYQVHGTVRPRWLER